jgi:hypothetical protein
MVNPNLAEPPPGMYISHISTDTHWCLRCETCHESRFSCQKSFDLALKQANRHYATKTHQNKIKKISRGVSVVQGLVG